MPFRLDQSPLEGGLTTPSNLKHAAGERPCSRGAKRADVLVQNWRRPEATGWALPYDALRPSIRASCLRHLRAYATTLPPPGPAYRDKKALD